MANRHSYTITISNNKSEKEALDFLTTTESSFLNPSSESRKLLIEILGINKKHSKAFDLIMIPGYTNLENSIEFNQTDQIILIELKTTQKKLVNLPAGFFLALLKANLS